MKSAIYFSRSINPNDARRLRGICDDLSISLLFENGFIDLIRKIVRLKPRFIFLDGDGTEIVYISKLLMDDVYKKLKVIVLSDSFQCDNANLDVVSIDDLEKFILNLREYYHNDPYMDFPNCESRIKSFLLNLGFNASSKGFDYIFECIYLFIQNNQYKCLKECYQVIKCNYDINNENNIDRDMRSAIQNAYELNKQSWHDLFSNLFDKKPTCKNFICLSVNKLREELLQN